MLKPHRTILVVHNTAQSSPFYQHQLQQDATCSYQVLTTQSVVQTSTFCRSQQIDGIILDLHSSNSENFKLFTHLKQEMGDRCPPIVMVDGGDTTVAVRALKHGAADYLVRDRMTPEDLRCAVRSAIENAKLKQKLQRSQERFQASIDTLMDCFGIFSSIRDESGKIIDFRIDYLNDAACKNNQMSRESQIGRGLCEVLPGHIESGLFDAYCHLVETGEPIIKDSLVYEDTYSEVQHLARAYDIRAAKLDDGFVASWRDITQRKQMELEMNEALHLLQQKQHNLDQLINTAPIGIGIGAADGSIRMVNDAMLRFHGYTREEFEREVTNWRSLVPPEAMEVTQQALEQLHQHGISPPHEKELLRRDGSRFPVWISATQWSNGTTNEHVSFVVDLTHQKQVEADLRASQQRYRDLAEAMPQIVWTADASGNITYWNQRWYEYTGLSEAASMGIEGIQTVHPDDRDRILAQWNQCILQGQPFETEYRVRRWDGVYHWFIGRGVPSYNDQQQIIGWIGTLTDIDNLKRNEDLLCQREQQLHQQLAELEAIYQTAPIGLTILDRDLRFLRINQRLAEINGLSIEAHIGRTVREVLPALADVAEPLLQSILDTGEPRLNVEINGETPAQPGIQRTWIEHFLPLKDGDRTIGISIVCEEITQRKQAEEALRRSEERYRTLFESMNDGFCVIQLLFDEQNTPIDYRLIEINPMFEHHTGLKDALGKTVRQLLPDLEAHWFEIYGKVALTGEPIRFEQSSDALQRWFDVSAFRIGQPEERKVALLFKEISDRKRAELALKEAHIQLESALAAGAIYTWCWNIPDNRVMINRDFAILFNFNPEEAVVGLPMQQFLNVVHAEDRPRVLAAIEQAIATKTPFAEEYRIRQAEGSERWLMARGQVEYDEAGNPLMFPGALADITELRQTEIALRQATERLNLALSSVPITLFTQDCNLRYTWIYNPTHQLSVAEVLGRRDEDLAAPEVTQPLTRLKRLVLETGIGLREEVKITLNDITTYYDLTIEPLRNEFHAIVGITCAAVDITDRIRAELALRDNERLLRLAMAGADAGSWLWEIASNQVIWSPENMNLYGLDRANGAITYEDWYNALHPEDRDRVQAEVQQVIEQRLPELRSEFRIVHPQRGVRWLLGLGRLTLDEQGNPLRLSGINLDITDRKQAEQALAQRAKELSELTQRLEKLMIDLRQRNQDLRQFAYVVSHDLKAPLRGIRNLAEWLQQDLGDRIPSENQKQLHLLIGRVNHMEALIVDLLEYCRVGQVKQAPESIATGELIQDVLHTLSIPPQIHIQITQPTPTILARRLMMRQVLTNLIGNAIKHGCPNQQGQVTITIQETSEGYQFAIADQGPGIDPKHHTKIFGIFETLRPKDRINSTGIGLAIVKKLVEAEQGKIWVDSALGNGATFYFTLPRYCVHTSPDFC